MQTKTYNTYKFDELTYDQKEKAIANLRDINVDYEWWEHIYEDASTIGLRITSFDLDRNRNATGEFMVLGGGEQCASLIMVEHGDTTDTYKLAKTYLAELETLKVKYPKHKDDEHNDYDEYFEKAGLLTDEFLHDLLEEYSVILQNEYEYLCSDDAIIDTIQANEYDFTENGKID